MDVRRTIKTDHGRDGLSESLVFPKIRFEVSLTCHSSETPDDEEGDEHEDSTEIFSVKDMKVRED